MITATAITVVSVWLFFIQSTASGKAHVIFSETVKPLGVATE